MVHRKDSVKDVPGLEAREGSHARGGMVATLRHQRYLASTTAVLSRWWWYEEEKDLYPEAIGQ